LDVNGIWGGYTGAGAKQLSLSQAFENLHAFSTQPRMEHITSVFTKHFMSIAFDSVTVKVTPHHGGQGYVTI
jgi:hypothetical protein